MHCVRASIYGSMFFVHLTIVKLYNCYFNYHPITHLEFDFTVGWVFLKYFLILCMLNWLQKHYFCGILIGQMFILNLKSHFKWKQDHILILIRIKTHIWENNIAWEQFPPHPHWSICEQMLYLWSCKSVQDDVRNHPFHTFNSEEIY